MSNIVWDAANGWHDGPRVNVTNEGGRIASRVSLTKRDALTGEPIRTYAIGHNLAGYSPDPDSVDVFAGTWSEACEVFRIIVCEYADRDDEGYWEFLGEYGEDDEHPMMLATVDSILRDYAPETSRVRDGHYAMTVEDNSGRYVAFWLCHAKTRL